MKIGSQVRKGLMSIDRRIFSLFAMLTVPAISAFSQTDEVQNKITSALDAVKTILESGVFRTLVIVAIMFAGVMLVINKDSEGSKRKFAVIFIGAIIFGAATSLAAFMIDPST